MNMRTAGLIAAVLLPGLAGTVGTLAPGSIPTAAPAAAARGCDRFDEPPRLGPAPVFAKARAALIVVPTGCGPDMPYRDARAVGGQGARQDGRGFA